MGRPTRASRGSVVRWPELGPWGHTTSGFGLWATLPFTHRMVFLMELAWRSAGSSHVLLSVKCLRQCLIPCDMSLAVVVTAAIIKSWMDAALRGARQGPSERRVPSRGQTGQGVLPGGGGLQRLG